MNNTKERECDIQKSCISWYRNTYTDYLIFSVPNEGCYRRKNYFEQLGMLSGVSDTIVILPNKTLFIEFKTLKSYQRPEQREFENKVSKLGFSYFVCRSLEEFKEIINSQLV